MFSHNVNRKAKFLVSKPHLDFFSNLATHGCHIKHLHRMNPNKSSTNSKISGDKNITYMHIDMLNSYLLLNIKRSIANNIDIY